MSLHLCEALQNNSEKPWAMTSWKALANPEDFSPRFKGETYSRYMMIIMILNLTSPILGDCWRISWICVICWWVWNRFNPHVFFWAPVSSSSACAPVARRREWYFGQATKRRLPPLQKPGSSREGPWS